MYLIATTSVSVLSSSPSPSPSSSTPSPDYEQRLDFELDDQGEIARPEMLLSDWMSLLFLFLLLLFGLPLNAIALYRQLYGAGGGPSGASSLFSPRRKTSASGGAARISRQDVTRTNFLWLRLHLTIVDLLCLCCYCPTHIAWLIGYTWSVGEFLCKMMQYSWDFVFHLMSFGVAIIALDRLRTVYGLMRMSMSGRPTLSPARQLLFVKRLIGWSYIAAALVSLPQWVVWTTVQPTKGWQQCTTIWHKMRVLEFLAGQESTESFGAERWYTLVHLLTVFWLPFLAILLAYLFLGAWSFFYALQRPPAGYSPSASSGFLPCTPLIQPDAEQGPSPGQNPNPAREDRTVSRTATQQTLGPLLAPLKGTEQDERLTPAWSFCQSSSATGTASSSCPTMTSTTTTSSGSSNGHSPGGRAPLLQRNATFSGSTRHRQTQHRTSDVPAWRLEIRSKIQKTTVLVISAYLVCWLPYNVLALATFLSKSVQISISVHLELLRICVLLNAVLNPFIYSTERNGGFKRGSNPS